jgi:hypothetical protein
MQGKLPQTDHLIAISRGRALLLMMNTRENTTQRRHNVARREKSSIHILAL